MPPDPAAPCPCGAVWTEAGDAANLPAAAEDALEWLRALQPLAQGRLRVDDQARLLACIAALDRHLRSFAPAPDLPRYPPHECRADRHDEPCPECGSTDLEELSRLDRHCTACHAEFSSGLEEPGEFCACARCADYAGGEDPPPGAWADEETREG